MLWFTVSFWLIPWTNNGLDDDGAKDDPNAIVDNTTKRVANLLLNVILRLLFQIFAYALSLASVIAKALLATRMLI